MCVCMPLLCACVCVLVCYCQFVSCLFHHNSQLRENQSRSIPRALIQSEHYNVWENIRQKHKWQPSFVYATLHQPGDNIKGWMSHRGGERVTNIAVLSAQAPAVHLQYPVDQGWATCGPRPLFCWPADKCYKNSFFLRSQQGSQFTIESQNNIIHKVQFLNVVVHQQSLNQRSQQKTFLEW